MDATPFYISVEYVTNDSEKTALLKTTSLTEAKPIYRYTTQCIIVWIESKIGKRFYNHYGRTYNWAVSPLQRQRI
jgi:hypothetical protein